MRACNGFAYTHSSAGFTADAAAPSRFRCASSKRCASVLLSPPPRPPNCTNSRKMVKWGSCVANANMIRSASKPCKMWCWLGS